MNVENHLSGIYREDNPKVFFELKVEGEDGKWEPVDITEMAGYIFLTIRKEIEDDTVLLDRAVSIEDGEKGKCSYHFTREETKSLWQSSRYQKEVGGNGVIGEIVYREDEDEVTYGQFWIKLMPDVRRI